MKQERGLKLRKAHFLLIMESMTILYHNVPLVKNIMFVNFFCKLFEFQCHEIVVVLDSCMIQVLVK